MRNSLCSSVHFYLRNISKIRQLLDMRTTATLVHGYVTSRLDNGNALLCGLPQTLLSKVQRVQNAELCSPCVSDWPTEAHNSSTERTTLAACQSADFIQGASADPSSTAWDCTSVHDRSTFPVPANKITICSSDALLQSISACAAPRLWNGLPISLRSVNNLNSFKKALKTFLFKDAYNM